jgi:hypothetical protein
MYSNYADHRENVKGACCRKLGVSNLCPYKYVLDRVIIMIINSNPLFPSRHCTELSHVLISRVYTERFRPPTLGSNKSY